jgi:hypothetical protein
VVDIDISKPKMGPGEALALGIDFQTYSRDFDRAISEAYVAAEHKKQADAEQARLKALDSIYEIRRAAEANWAPVVVDGLDIECRSCHRVSRYFGHHRDGFDSTRVDEPHLFIDLESRHVLTFACGECGRSNAVCLGRIASDAPVNYTSWNSLVKRFGEATREVPVSVEGEKKPSLRERFLGAGQ